MPGIVDKRGARVEDAEVSCGQGCKMRRKCEALARGVVGKLVRGGLDRQCRRWNFRVACDFDTSGTPSMVLVKRNSGYFRLNANGARSCQCGRFNHVNHLPLTR
jgi:hypothetical protein